MSQRHDDLREWRRRAPAGKHLFVCAWCGQSVVTRRPHLRCAEAADRALNDLIPTRGRRPRT